MLVSLLFCSINSFASERSRFKMINPVPQVVKAWVAREEAWLLPQKELEPSLSAEKSKQLAFLRNLQNGTVDLKHMEKYGAYFSTLPQILDALGLVVVQKFEFHDKNS